MTENNSASRVLSDEEIQDAADGFDIYGAKPEFARAIEQAVLSKLRAHVTEETYTDDNGTVWERPTAWAYAQVCKALNKCRRENPRVKPAGDERMRAALDLGRAAEAAERAAYTDPLSDFQEGQWWVKELDELARAPGATHDQKRAVAVVHHMLRSAALASAPVTDESPMAKMADALREKARQEQQAYQDRRNQATEWGPMPEGTEADSPTSSAPVAHVAGDEVSRHLEWAKDRSAWEMPVGTPVYYSVLASAPVAGEVREHIEQMAVNRYRPVPDGKLSYKVVAGDGTRSLYTGTKDSCLRVAAKLTEAFLDGAFVASDAAPQASEALQPGEIAVDESELRELIELATGGRMSNWPYMIEPLLAAVTDAQNDPPTAPAATVNHPSTAVRTYAGVMVWAGDARVTHGIGESEFRQRGLVVSFSRANAQVKDLLKTGTVKV